MAPTIPTPTLATVADKTEIEANFQAVEDHHNAGHTTADLTADAGILNAQLANSIYEVLVNLVCTDVVWQSADAAGDILALASIPGTSGGDDTYTGIAYNWACTDCGAQSGLFRIEWGYFDSAGAWQVVSTPINDVTLTSNSAANNTAGASGAAFSTVLSLATDYTPANQGPRMLALVMDTDDATALSTTAGTPNFLSVTLKLKRTLGLRS